MVNFHDPVTVARESLALVNFWHVTNGIFIWEFFTTLYYEWDVIQGRRTHRWTIWVYSLTRAITLSAIILDLIGLDTTTRINCQVWATFSITFAYGAYMASSLLIVLRVIAVWNKDKIVVVISTIIWMTDVAFLVNAIVRFRASWSSEANTCVFVNEESTTFAYIVLLFADIALLLIMLIGLLRLRIKTGGVFGFGRILWNQGLVWFLVAIAAEVPPVVFMLLNLNAPLNFMFLDPCMITVTIAATRMYRSLTNFDSSKMSHLTPRGSIRVLSEMKARSEAGPIPLNQMKVSVITQSNQFSTSKVSCVSTDQGHQAP